jgi:hypothetical protein
MTIRPEMRHPPDVRCVVRSAACRHGHEACPNPGDDMRCRQPRPPGSRRGLIAVIIGCWALVAAAVLPPPLPFPDNVLTSRALHPTVGPITRRPMARRSAGVSSFTASGKLIVTDGHRDRGETYAVRQSAGREGQFKEVPDALEAALARGTRTESAHIATVPVSADTVNFLTAMTWQLRRTDPAYLATCPCSLMKRATD